jgi:RNA-binding protein
MNREDIHTLRATIWIGKQGLTENILMEIRQQLKSRKMVKIRWLRNIEIDPDEIARDIGARVIDVRGRTMVLAESHKKRDNFSPRNI